METYADLQGIAEVSEQLRGFFSKSEFYQSVDKKFGSEQLLYHLDRAMQKAKSDHSLSKYNFDAEIESIINGVGDYNTRLARTGEFLGLLAVHYDTAERTVISRLSPPQAKGSGAIAQNPQNKKRGSLFRFEEGEASGVLFDYLLGHTTEIDGQSYVSVGENRFYNSGGTHIERDISFAQAKGVIVVGESLRIPVGFRVGQLHFETGSAQEDKYASRQKQTGKDGTYNDHGTTAGSSLSFDIVGLTVGLGHQDSEGSTDFTWSPGLGVGESLLINQYEVRDECGYTGTQYTKMDMPVGISVQSKRKKHAIDYL